MQARHYRIGTMGFSYDDWRGSFYPEAARSRDYLAAYAEHFDIVEVDSTWYGMPRRETVDRWMRVTPDHFRFTLKCPQEITHKDRLENVKPAIEVLAEQLRRFESKLSFCLFQFPSNFRAVHAVRMKRLFDALPQDLRFAVEIRDRSWLEIDLPALAAEHGVTWVVSDLVSDLAVTTDTVYLRLLGDHDLDIPFDRESLDITQDLESWGEKLRSLPGKVTEVVGFINNHYSGHSPATASRLRQLLGLPPIEIRRQATLFD
jgi:uncharacterized protein YecE (DUF72 family)